MRLTVSVCILLLQAFAIHALPSLINGVDAGLGTGLSASSGVSGAGAATDDANQVLTEAGTSSNSDHSLAAESYSSGSVSKEQEDGGSGGNSRRGILDRIVDTVGNRRGMGVKFETGLGRQSNKGGLSSGVGVEVNGPFGFHFHDKVGGSVGPDGVSGGFSKGIGIGN